MSGPGYSEEMASLDSDVERKSVSWVILEESDWVQLGVFAILLLQFQLRHSHVLISTSVMQ
jgi:hypothetical protein